MAIIKQADRRLGVRALVSDSDRVLDLARIDVIVGQTPPADAIQVGRERHPDVPAEAFGSPIRETLASE